MLDKRLLTACNFEANPSHITIYQEEFSALERLKKRFSDKSLHSCDVMLRDIKDSDRLLAHISKKFTEQKFVDSETGRKWKEDQ